jgi:23S rRNA (pseudouridine1915-N3)-methyltransferase
MKWTILAIGKPALDYAKSGVAEYEKRLSRHGGVEIVTYREAGRVENSRRLLEASEGCLRIVLDERGELLTTAELSARVAAWELDRVKRVAVLIGGADGHDASVRSAADLVLGLSRLTLQHELALVVFLEQLYRVGTVRRGEPYHR